MKDNEAGLSFKALKDGLIWLGVFLAIGIWRWQATGSIFYVLNFGYIGLSLLIGDTLSKILPNEKKPTGRRVTQLLIGLYMLGFLGFIGNENMQLEGFFFYLFAGYFAGSTLHYFIAKIVGPLFFGRGWCGWACWTTMVLDFLPWQAPINGRKKYAGALRYIHFLISFGLIFFLLNIKGYNPEVGGQREFYWLILGNIFYYASAVVLAIVLKDNRAFCKYLCPIPVFMKITSGFAVLKQKIDNNLCNDCGICEENCPMDIKLLDYSKENKRILSSECVLCSTCEYVCPENAIKTTTGIDFQLKQRLNIN